KGARFWTCSLSKPVLPVQPGFSLANTVFSWCLRPELGYWHPVHRSHLAGPVGQESGKAMTGDALLRVMTVLAAAPLLLAIITKVKALFAGRRGAPLLQNSDLGKLLRKGAAYSTTTTGIFPVGPVVSLAAIVLAFTIVPMAEKSTACLPWDFLLLIYRLGLAHLSTTLAALDTGSSWGWLPVARRRFQHWPSPLSSWPWRLLRVPQLLAGAAVLSLLAFVLLSLVLTNFLLLDSSRLSSEIQ
ncbi:MAG: NADH-quinone oxidoreductase subunit H, partial [Thermoanaerobaculaceae bacterium]